VTWNAYGGEEKKLKAVQKVLEGQYDCLFTYRIPSHKSDPHLIVAPKGAFQDPTLIFNKDEAVHAMKESGQHQPRYRELKVLAVMIRQDVWDAYAGTTIEAYRWSKEPPITVDFLHDKLQKVWEQQVEHARKWEEKLKKMEAGEKTEYLELGSMLRQDTMRSILFELPFQTMPGTHIGEAIKDTEFKGREELLRGVAELAQIEAIMERLHQPWYIPPLGGQEPEWKLRTSVLQKVVALSAAELKKEQDEYEGEES
jgi:hypothetical protein